MLAPNKKILKSNLFKYSFEWTFMVYTYCMYTMQSLSDFLAGASFYCFLK